MFRNRCKTSKDKISCEECDGKGKKSRFFRSPCTACDGKGYRILKRCSKCGGIGREEKSDTLTINVPGGVQQGQLLRIKGKGNASLGNKDNGDLLLTVQIASHPVLERRGRDVYCEVPLLWHEAILGTSLTIPTLEGQLKSVFNTHTHQYSINRTWTPDSNNQNCGDLHIRVIIELPQSLTAGQELASNNSKELLPNQTPKRQAFEQYTSLTLRSTGCLLKEETRQISTFSQDNVVISNCLLYVARLYHQLLQDLWCKLQSENCTHGIIDAGAVLIWSRRVWTRRMMKQNPIYCYQSEIPPFERRIQRSPSWFNRLLNLTPPLQKRMLRCWEWLSSTLNLVKANH